ncbi:MAG: hypothetical protein QOE70_5575 [Chthoniobacter sp.]|nr:hypothetical protein [Chthoniobacter sp.]
MKLRFLIVAIAFALASCAHRTSTTLIRVSVPNQKIIVFQQGVQVAMYDCSTSKYGIGDQPGSYRTPVGRLQVVQKIGDGLPSGMKLKSRQPTGEIVKPDSPGRDPIVSRILWLRGLERQNAHAYNRAIYIHGTAEERTIGTPASYGCVRMRSKDVIKLYSQVGVGAVVEIMPYPFPAPLVQPPTAAPSPSPAPVAAVPAAVPAAPVAATPPVAKPTRATASAGTNARRG